MSERGKTHPLVTKVDDLRLSLDVPIDVMAQMVGISRIAYYGWLRGASHPTSANQRALMYAARALMAAAKCGDIPLRKEAKLPSREHKARIKTIVLRYLNEV